MAEQPDVVETTAAEKEVPVSLSPSGHKGLKVRQSGTIEHLKHNHIAKVYTPEFISAGVDYPIVFVKDPNTEEFFSVVIWGVDPGENNHIEGDKWTGGFVPSSVRSFPFTVALNPEDKNRLFIGIYEKSPLINKEEGELMFNDDGTETEWMSEIKEFLVRVYEQEQMTKTFSKQLDTLGLLIPQSISMKMPNDGSDKTIDGFYIVDREKLLALGEDDFKELRSKNALEVIYAHLMSLGTLGRLMEKKLKADQA